jgi:hypothetical protein
MFDIFRHSKSLITCCYYSILNWYSSCNSVAWRESIMKKTLMLYLVILMAGTFFACGGSDETAPEPSGPTWSLIEDDGVGVIFTSYEEGGAVASQIKFYDNELRKILNDESFNGGSGISTFELSTMSARIYLFGLEYDGVSIDTITCDYEKGSNTQLQLSFACYDNAANMDEIVELRDPFDANVVPCDKSVIADPLNGIYAHTAHSGIMWEKLIHMAYVPMREDRTLYCTGGNKTFYLDIFDDTGIREGDFTLFFDFVANTYRGKMVITEVHKDPDTDGKVLRFKGLQ